jgi:hypothetical protein
MIMVPVPKKGDISICDNWRGISLIELLGKVFARVIQNRLQSVAETGVDVLPESQCGFRPGRGTIDMVLNAAPAVEGREHGCLLYTFVDPKKAYDTVSRPLLWKLLLRLGVPDVMVDIIKSMHEGIRPCGWGSSEPFNINTGATGVYVGPMLFNLFFAAVLRSGSEMRRARFEAGGAYGQGGI